MFRSRLLFDAQLQTERLAGCCISIPRGSGSPLERSQRPYGYQDSLVHFGIARFFAAIPTELRSRRRGGDAFLRKHISLAMLSAGRTLGLRAPNLRQRAIGSLDSLHWIRGKVPKQYNSLSETAKACFLFTRRATLGYTERPVRL